MRILFGVVDEVTLHIANRLTVSHKNVVQPASKYQRDHFLFSELRNNGIHFYKAMNESASDGLSISFLAVHSTAWKFSSSHCHGVNPV